MAYGILNYDGVVTPVSSAYPNGNIKDDAPGDAGTVVNVKSNQDIQQFFAKLMNQAGITPNGLPDNETNGYQMLNALYAPLYSSTGIVFTNSGNNVWGNAGSGTYNIAYQKLGNNARLCGIALNSAGGTPPTTSVMTLPAIVRPASPVTIQAMALIASVYTMIPLDISTAGVVTSVIPVGGTEIIYFENITYRLA